jgi:DNA-binding PadR family transcriptional regulator
MKTNFHFFWPRAESSVYEEPKRLTEDRLVRARSEHVGKRPRTVYAITPKGRRALARWLAQPPTDTRIESEVLLKLMLAPYGSKDAILNSLRAFNDHVEARRDSLLQMFRLAYAGTVLFPDRVHVNDVLFRLIWDYTEAEQHWVRRAIEIVERWPDVTTPAASSSLQLMAEIIQDVDNTATSL